MPWRPISCLIRHHAMRTYWGNGGIAPRILNLGTRWKWVVSFMPRPHYPRRKSPVIHWIGGWVGPRAGLGAVAKREKFHYWLCRESNAGRPARSLVSVLTELLRFLYIPIRRWNMRIDTRLPSQVFILCTPYKERSNGWHGDTIDKESSHFLL
jgi:hypothetical protein